jgi:predicted nucleic acid-binding protein
VSLVLDASVTLAWIYSEETTQEINAAFELIADDCAWVPGLWRIEVANSLTVSLRKGRITAGHRLDSLSDLEFVPIFCDQETNDRAWTQTLALADRHGLTVYDATYLELAMRRGLPLATLDRELRQAAAAEGVPLLGK